MKDIALEIHDLDCDCSRNTEIWCRTSANCFQELLCYICNNLFLESRKLPYVYRFLQTNVIISQGSVTSRCNMLLKFLLLNSEIRGLWSLAEPRIVHFTQ